MKIFLLPLDHRPSVFYSEDDDEANDAVAPIAGQSGLHGWFVRSTRNLKASLKHPEGRFARMAKRTWDWLHRRMHPDEKLLAALRSAAMINVYHRSSLTTDEVSVLWSAYLKRRFRRSLLWLIINTLLSPLTLLLTPLPGPNIIGYWFAYRAVHHLLVIRGIRRVLSGRVETTFHPLMSLDSSGDWPDRAWLTLAAREFELKGLHEFVERVEVRMTTVTAVDDDAHDDANARDGMQRSCDC